jgi:DNA polymerase (family 10)
MSSTRTNGDVAAVFAAIAEILEGQGENPFKVRAYRNAVRTLDDLDERVADVAARGELRKIAGFGEAIAAKTQEILATGTCELYERLKKERDAEAAGEDAVVAEPAESDAEDVASPW